MDFTLRPRWKHVFRISPEPPRWAGWLAHFLDIAFEMNDYSGWCQKHPVPDQPLLQSSASKSPSRSNVVRCSHHGMCTVYGALAFCRRDVSNSMVLSVYANRSVQSRDIILQVRRYVFACHQKLALSSELHTPKCHATTPGLRLSLLLLHQVDFLLQRRQVVAHARSSGLK